MCATSISLLVHSEYNSGFKSFTYNIRREILINEPGKKSEINPVKVCLQNDQPNTTKSVLNRHVYLHFNIQNWMQKGQKYQR